MDNDRTRRRPSRQPVGNLPARAAINQTILFVPADRKVVIEGDEGDLVKVLREPGQHLLSVFEEDGARGRNALAKHGAHRRDAGGVVFEDGNDRANWTNLIWSFCAHVPRSWDRWLCSAPVT